MAATFKELTEHALDPRLQAFIGKTVLVGLYQFHEGRPHKRTQETGKIAGFENGMMVLERENGRSFYPVTYRALLPAPRGKYTLDSTGEEVVNPDFLLSWRLDLEDKLEDSQWEANTAPHFASIVGREWAFEYGSGNDSSYREVLETRRDEYIGRTIMVGLRQYRKREDGGSELVEQTQVFGRIVRINLSEGIVVEPRNGPPLKLPPDLAFVQFAPPGEYTLQSTGEVVINPDLMTMWSRSEK